MKNKEKIIDQINGFLEPFVRYLSMFLFGFTSLVGFVFGSFALLIIFAEKGVNTYIIELVFKLFNFLLKLFLIALLVRITFLIAKYVSEKKKKWKNKKSTNKKKS